MYKAHVVIPSVDIKGDLFIPSESKAIIIFVHGSGSNRFSFRNKFISTHFNEQGIATLLVDLLTEKEKEEDITTKHIRFDLELLTQRLIVITQWIMSNPLTKNLLIGYFSYSTGTAAALNASINFNKIGAIVSMGGRTDLLENSVLNKITTPSLFIIGEKDNLIVSFNKRAYKEIISINSKDMSIIPNASHFFEEQGKIEEVSNVAIQWFKCYLLKNQKKFINSYRIKSSPFSFFNLKSKFQMKFLDRNSAAYILANILNKYKFENKNNVIIVGIPRGGIIIANIIAQKISLKNFNIILSKRLRNPHNLENTIGAIFQDGTVYIAPEFENLSFEYIQMEITKQKKELEKQIMLYQIQNEKYEFKDKTVILVDDGCHSGSTIRVTCNWIKSYLPEQTNCCNSCNS
jgi:predicted phosphoribosyltransferase/dienelactone hydrolase